MNSPFDTSFEASRLFNGQDKHTPDGRTDTKTDTLTIIKQKCDDKIELTESGLDNNQIMNHSINKVH